MQAAKLSRKAQTEPKSSCRNAMCSRFLDWQTKSKNIYWMVTHCFQLVICLAHIYVVLDLSSQSWTLGKDLCSFFYHCICKNLHTFWDLHALVLNFWLFSLCAVCNQTKPDSKRQQVKYQFCCESCLANKLTGVKAAIKSIWTKLNQIRDGIASADAFVITITKAAAITKAVMKKKRSR